MTTNEKDKDSDGERDKNRGAGDHSDEDEDTDGPSIAKPPPVRDVLLRELDADGHRVLNLGKPAGPREATYTDNESKPSPVGSEASPGKSRLAAPADHVHAGSVPMRVAASGRKTLIAGGATVTLATIKRKGGELFVSGGFLWVRDDEEVSWENKVEGARQITAYHERTDKSDEVKFKAKNNGKHNRTIDWASVALVLDD
jgi:hypothetical protein